MSWYDLRKFHDRIEDLEKFLIDLAATEGRLQLLGLGVALQLDSAEKGLQAMGIFGEEFSRVKRLAVTTDRMLSSDIQSIESESKLLENISLIELRLKMAQVKKPNVLGAMERVASVIPSMGWLLRRKPLFGEEPISLQRTIIALGRLRSVTKGLEDILLQREMGDNEVLKPSNVDRDRVVQHIDLAIEQLREGGTLSPTQRAQITEYLQEAKAEIISSRPAWSKIVGALVIAAAITTGIADLPHAAENVKAAIDHILGISIERSGPRSLPPPMHSANVLPIRV